MKSFSHIDNVSQVYTQSYAGTTTFDRANGLQQKVSLTGDVTLALTGFVAGDVIDLTIVSDGSIRAVTFFSGITWRDAGQGTSFSTVASHTYEFIFKCTGTNTYDGWVLTNDSSGSTADMVLAGTQTVSGAKTFNDGTLKLAGSSSGATTLKAPAAAGTDIITLPSGTGTLAFTGAASTNFLLVQIFS